MPTARIIDMVIRKKICLNLERKKIENARNSL